MQSNPAHVYCLNRSHDGATTQRKRNASHGLPTAYAGNNITFLTANLSDPLFGLDSEMYSNLLSSVTHVIHNAWWVDFNIPLSSYLLQLHGVVNLIEFSSTALQSPSLLYTSSVSSASYLERDSIPETIIDDELAAAPTGYGASKYVAEHLLNHAAQKLSMDIRIARVG